MGLADHPDHEYQQGGGPHPAEPGVDRGAKHQQEKAAESHERGGYRSPRLRLVGETHREQGEHRPPHGESAQDGAGDTGFVGRNERRGGQEQCGEESGSQRPGDEPTDVSLRSWGGGWGWTRPVSRSGGGHGMPGGSHDGLHSLQGRRASTAVCTCGTCRHFDSRAPTPPRAARADLDYTADNNARTQPRRSNPVVGRKWLTKLARTDLWSMPAPLAPMRGDDATRPKPPQRCVPSTPAPNADGAGGWGEVLSACACGHHPLRRAWRASGAVRRPRTPHP